QSRTLELSGPGEGDARWRRARARAASAALHGDAACPSLGLDDGVRGNDTEPVSGRSVYSARRSAAGCYGGPVPADAWPVSRRWDIRARGTRAAGRRPHREDESCLDSSNARWQLYV